MKNKKQVQSDVKEYYGETLQNSDDLKTSACCPIEGMPKHLLPYLLNVHDEVREKFYGCGSPIPQALEGATVLDLGCGTGRDCYILSQIVGEKGKVVGVDMTDEQLSTANKHLKYHMDRFGYLSNNIEFRTGYIEDLKTVGIEDNSIDVVVSNCVINLSSNKEEVFREIFRVLKPGGELYFSDVFADRRLPEHLQKDKVMLGECLGGALYTEDFRRIMQKTGFLDFRVTGKGPVSLDEPKIIKQAGMIDFSSITIRAFKCDLEDVCENYGHVAYYKGTIEESPHSFVLDDHHEFKTGLPYSVCGNTANMLSQTRYAKHFKIIGDFSTHYGIFDCSDGDKDNQSTACC